MTAKIWTGETTTAGGTVMTAPNSSAGGTPLEYVQVTSPGAATFGATNPVIAGTRSIRLQQTVSGGTGRARAIYEFAASATRMQSRFAFRNRVDPNTGNMLAAIMDTTFGSPFPLQLAVTPRAGTRHTILQALGVEVKDFGPLSFGSNQSDYYWADCYVQKGNTTSTPKGTLGMRLFDYDGTQLDEYVSPVGGINVGTLNLSRMVWGGNAGIVMDEDIAWAKVTDEAAAFQGLPPMAVVPPGLTVPGRPLPYEAGTVKIGGFVATDPDGTIASIHATATGPNTPTVTAVDVTGLNTSNCTFALQFDALPATEYTVEVWVVDNSGMESDHETVGPVNSYGTGTIGILEDLTASGWTAFGGAPSNLAASTDLDDATGFNSGYAPSHVKRRYRLSAAKPGRPIKVFPKARREPAGGLDIVPVGRLFAANGTTLLQEKTVDVNSNPLTVGTTAAESAISFTPAITDPAQLVDLQVEFDYTQSS